MFSLRLLKKNGGGALLKLVTPVAFEEQHTQFLSPFAHTTAKHIYDKILTRAGC